MDSTLGIEQAASESAARGFEVVLDIVESSCRRR